MEPMPARAAGESKNGMTAEDLAGSGARLWSACTGRISPIDIMVWNGIATNAIKVIDEAIEASGNGAVDMSGSQFAKTLYQWSGDGRNFALQSPYIQLAWEAVGRHWISCLDVEGQLDVAESESLMLSWHTSKMTARPGSSNGNGYSAVKPLYPMPPDDATERVFGPTEKVQPHSPVAMPNTGSVAGFKKVIEMKMAEHRGKIACLEKLIGLMERAGPEADAALWDIFKDVLG